MKVLLLVALLATVFAAPLSEEQYTWLFTKWMGQFTKNYDAAEAKYRYSIFKNNLNFIISHNAEGHSYELGMNEFGDMTWEEFKGRYINGLGFRDYPFGKKSRLSTDNIPDAVDWRAEGAVTPVKDQKQCGSCWAFSATGAMEGVCKIKTGVLNSLSEQELVDCSKSYGNAGCRGGWMDYAFKYAQDKKGLNNENDYPYKAVDQACAAKPTRYCPLTGYADVTPNDELQLKAAVALNPVSVAIEADQPAFQFYKKGVFDGACGTSLDHGVLAVGYGVMDGKNMWIVKNSWGVSWGDQGYIYMIRKDATGPGQCGICKAASYPKM